MSVCVSVHERGHACMVVCARVRVFVFMCARVHVVQVRMRVFVYVYMCVCVNGGARLCVVVGISACA